MSPPDPTRGEGPFTSRTSRCVAQQRSWETTSVACCWDGCRRACSASPFATTTFGFGAPLTGERRHVEIRFREKSLLDVGELDVVVEVRTKLFASRVEDKQRRADLLHDRLAALEVGRLGVWLILAEGAWSQAAPISSA